jgi:flagella basal body P-ring formation protein FlgA
MFKRPASLLLLALCTWLALCAGAARAQAGATLDAAVLERVRVLAQTAAAAAAPPGARVSVELGALDARYKLAACQQVQPYLPTGLAMWGRSRVGLRCLDGAPGGLPQGARWSITLPVQVKVFARAVVAAGPLPAGVNLSQDQLATAEIDIAAEPGAVFTDAASLVGRTLARPLAAAEAVRAPTLKSRQWFAAGETVQVSAAGPGFVVVTEGQAMAAGIEGHEVRVRFESGRVVIGRAVGERRVELL